MKRTPEIWTIDKLIAAAPKLKEQRDELLEACIDALAYLTMQPENPTRFTETVEQLKRVITKAGGNI